MGVLTIEADDVTLDCENKQIAGGTPGTVSQTIDIQNSSNVTVQNCNINTSGTGAAINLTLSSGSTISSNTIADGAYGIYLDFGSTNNTISSNTIDGVLQSAIYLDAAENNNITGNNLMDNEYGIRFNGGGGGTLTNNEVCGLSGDIECASLSLPLIDGGGNIANSVSGACGIVASACD